MSTPAVNVERRSDAHQYVTVRIGGQLFGLPISAVNEVFVPDQITPVPLASREIDGVLNLRGRIVTMIDMRRLLGLADVSLARMAVGIERTGEAFALLIDGIGDVLLLDPSTYDSNPPNLDEEWMQFSEGVHRLEGELLVVLDVERVLATVGGARSAA
ncbi:chemotaxis protein CheW [Ancylobacter rudongensis]|uniref:CheW protein n=1 Tax=Ancylobacter rudongensis TaxID=177413 RepID=A0A1G4UNL6_9HYPH|nr:chemotaxis protein CheW [Ancylobacter rudongensis]SCW94545.1 CheW protein [Ancylobacter rudongensis]